MKKLLTTTAIAISLASPATAQIEPEPFELHSVVTFSEPTMSCPNVDDAVAADKHDAAWLDSRGCKNLDPGVKQWVVVNSGSGAADTEPPARHELRLRDKQGAIRSYEGRVGPSRHLPHGRLLRSVATANRQRMPVRCSQDAAIKVCAPREFDKAMVVAKLKGARERKRVLTGQKVEGRKSHAELRPDVVALVRQTSRY
jgi:hypothetical protein